MFHKPTHCFDVSSCDALYHSCQKRRLQLQILILMVAQFKDPFGELFDEMKSVKLMNRSSQTPSKSGMMETVMKKTLSKKLKVM